MQEVGFIWKLLSDFGITWGLYIIIVLWFLWYTPKLIRLHFEMIKEMQQTFKDSLEKITDLFEKKIEDSNKWHMKHQEEHRNHKADLAEIKKDLAILKSKN